MRLLRAGVAAFLIMGIANASRAGEALNQAPQLQAAVSAALEEFAVPGAAVGLWTPNGHWTATIGLGNVAVQRPVTRRDHFATRSITKSFVVTLVLQLVAQSAGSISLDDPIARYLPGIPNGGKITLRELANMTSGLYDYTRDPALGQAFQEDPKREWTTDELLAFAFNSPSHPPIDFDPGTRYEYANTNTLVLGKFIEAVTSKAFNDVPREQILSPLDLDSTFYLTGTQLPAGRRAWLSGRHP